MTHKTPEIIIISAISANGAIGYQGGLPWNIPEEFEMFLSFIKGQTIITGRKSYEHSCKMLSSKHNLLLSRFLNEVENALVFDSLAKAIQKAQGLNKTIYITGGAEVYKQAFDLADQMYLSFHRKEYQGDVFFPNFEKQNWVMRSKTAFAAYDFVIFDKKQGCKRF